MDVCLGPRRCRTIRASPELSESGWREQAAEFDLSMEIVMPPAKKSAPAIKKAPPAKAALPAKKAAPPKKAAGRAKKAAAPVKAAAQATVTLKQFAAELAGMHDSRRWQKPCSAIW